MDYAVAVLAGVVQGLTEFLPISSSGHLVLLHDMFRIELGDDVLFDVILHLGTLAALVVYFYRDLEKVIRGFFSSLTNWNVRNNFNQRLAWLVILGTVPAALIGALAGDLIEESLREPWIVALMLVLVAAVFWISERYSTRQRDVQQLTVWDALVVGLAQVVAFIPGTSRSGMTIVAGLWRGLRREEAARFSFVLAIPIIAGAGLTKIISVESWSAVAWPLLLVGFAASAATGYIVIRFLLRYLTHHSLAVFAWYRIALAGLIILWLAIR